MKTSHAQTFDYPKKNKKQLVSDTEIWALSYYQTSELAGSLLMGRWTRKVTDNELRSRMVWHAAEEARHAWRWTELIRKLGADPVYVPATYQSNYFAKIGIPKDTLEFLIITHVFEQRIARHFTLHKKRPGTHPLIKDLLTIMIEDEGPHLLWVRNLLNSHIQQGSGKEIEKKLKRYEKIDGQAYEKEAEIFAEHGWKI